MLRGGTQCHVFPRYQSEENENIEYSFTRVRLEPTTCHAYSRTHVALALYPASIKIENVNIFCSN